MVDTGQLAVLGVRHFLDWKLEHGKRIREEEVSCTAGFESPNKASGWCLLMRCLSLAWMLGFAKKN